MSVSPEKIMQVGLGFWPAKTLLSAVELGLFSELAKGPLPREALTQRLGLHRRSARDFLDSLVALGMLRRENGLYSNSAETDLFLDRAKPSYIGGVLEMANARLYPFWGSLTEALKTGQPQNEVKTGGSIFEVLYSDPARLRGFLRAMTGLSMGAHRAMAEKFPWKNYKTLVDVGTAEGGLPVEICKVHDHLEATGFDLQVVEPIFQEYIKLNNLSRRVRFRSGDFFKDPLPPAEVYVMGHILHDWNLDEKKMLLKKVYEALPDRGALIVYEAIIDDDRSQNAFGLMMSLNMLIETPGGFDYTGKECCAWMQEAGFRETRVEHLTGPDSMVVGIK